MKIKLNSNLVVYVIVSSLQEGGNFTHWCCAKWCYRNNDFGAQSGVTEIMMLRKVVLQK